MTDTDTQARKLRDEKLQNEHEATVLTLESFERDTGMSMKFIKKHLTTLHSRLCDAEKENVELRDSSTVAEALEIVEEYLETIRAALVAQETRIKVEQSQCAIDSKVTSKPKIVSVEEEGESNVE